MFTPMAKYSTLDVPQIKVFDKNHLADLKVN